MNIHLEEGLAIADMFHGAQPKEKILDLRKSQHIKTSCEDILHLLRLQ
jgi:hypothetical protein